MNQCYKHFYYFVTELNLVERKELEPLVSGLLQQVVRTSPGVTPLCGLYRYVRPKRVWFFSSFGHK